MDRVVDAVTKHSKAVDQVTKSLKDGQKNSGNTPDLGQLRQQPPQGGARQKTNQVNPTRPPQKEPDQINAARADKHERPDNKDNADRTTLIVGDSTVKLLDKRRLYRNQTISKCRAGTIYEAFQKIRTGGSHQMKNIILCVGLNDIRNGNNVDAIVDDMKCLLEETQLRHPECSVHLCSILPVDTGKVAKQDIDRVNSHFQHFGKYMDNVYYIDLLSAFVSHGSLGDLFESDRIHPNLKGTILMMQTMRHSLQHEHRPLRNFVSKRTTPDVSYAQCVSNGTMPSQLPPNPSEVKPATTVGGLPASAHRMYPSIPWWPPGYYPPMMPAGPFAQPPRCEPMMPAGHGQFAQPRFEPRPW